MQAGSKPFARKTQLAATEFIESEQNVLFVWFDSLHLSQQVFSFVRTGIPGMNQSKQGLMCLAQGHNTLTPVSLQPITPRLKSSTLPLSHCAP